MRITFFTKSILKWFKHIDITTLIKQNIFLLIYVHISSINWFVDTYCDVIHFHCILFLRSVMNKSTFPHTKTFWPVVRINYMSLHCSITDIVTHLITKLYCTLFTFHGCIVFLTLRKIYRFTSEFSLPSSSLISFVGLKTGDIALTHPWSAIVLTPEEELIRNVHGSRMMKQISASIPKMLSVGLLPSTRKLIAKVIHPINSTNQAMKFTLMVIWHIWARLFLWSFDNDSDMLDLTKLLKCIIGIFHFNIWPLLQFIKYIIISVYLFILFHLPVGMFHSPPVKPPFNQIRCHSCVNNKNWGAWKTF